PSPQSPQSSSNEEGQQDEDGLFPGLNAKAARKKVRKKPSSPVPPERIEARKITQGFYAAYGKHYAQPEVSVRKLVEDALTRIDRDTVAWSLDLLGRERRPITGNTLQIALGQVAQRRTAEAQRTAARCTEHRMVLPCGACAGEIGAGDLETPLRLLAEHGPEVRWDLAHLERKSA